MISCLCPGCGTRLAAEDRLAGRTIACPTCGGVVQVSAAEPATAQPRADHLEAGQLPAPRGPARLDRQCHYLICDNSHLVAAWENDGCGWMLATDFGLVSATRNPEQLPSQGVFQLIELRLKMTGAGLRIEDLVVYQLAEHWALTKLAESDDAILTAVTGRAALVRAQKDAVRDAIHQQFMRDVWASSPKVMDYLASADYHAHGTR
jgi:hypothetical protein